MYSLNRKYKANWRNRRLKGIIPQLFSFFFSFISDYDHGQIFMLAGCLRKKSCIPVVHFCSEYAKLLTVNKMHRKYVILLIIYIQETIICCSVWHVKVQKTEICFSVSVKACIYGLQGEEDKSVSKAHLPCLIFTSYYSIFLVSAHRYWNESEYLKWSDHWGQTDRDPRCFFIRLWLIFFIIYIWVWLTLHLHWNNWTVIPSRQLLNMVWARS